MKDRLQRFLTSEGLSPAKLADEIGVQRSSISHLLAGRNKPGFDFIYKFSLRYSKVNTDWLITGRGSMYKSKDAESANTQPHNQDDNAKKNDQADTQNISKFTNVNNVERVVFFFNDGTFKEYAPR